MKAKTTDEFVAEATAVHNSKYDYSETDYVNATTPVVILCKCHGAFLQQPNHHLEGSGCPKCAIDKNTDHLNDFVSKANIVHNNVYDYSKVNYVNSKKKVIIVCPRHGEFLQKPNNHLRGQACPKCKESKGEKAIERYLSEHDIRYIHDKACLPFLGKLRPDFYLPDYNMVIEYDGKQHFESVPCFGGERRLEEQKKNDARKQKLCFENDVMFVKISYFDNFENILNEYFL